LHVSFLFRLDSNLSCSRNTSSSSPGRDVDHYLSLFSLLRFQQLYLIILLFCSSLAGFIYVGSPPIPPRFHLSLLHPLSAPDFYSTFPLAMELNTCKTQSLDTRFSHPFLDLAQKTFSIDPIPCFYYTGVLLHRNVKPAPPPPPRHNLKPPPYPGKLPSILTSFFLHDVDFPLDLGAPPPPTLFLKGRFSLGLISKRTHPTFNSGVPTD